MKKTKIICVVGATASGKTALSVELAKRLGGEIISADSMQVYRDMEIATAAATEEEQEGIPHHLIGFLSREETFSVAEFVRLAKELIEDIDKRGKVPIIAGGTGLFIDSLVNNIAFCDIGANEELRQSLESKSNEELFNELCALDKEAAADIHPNNRKRVIRALELCCGGSSKTQQNISSRLDESPYEALYIGIGYRDRNRLYERINLRVDKMAQAGLVDEAKRVYKTNSLTARQAIGHKELIPFLEGRITLDTALDRLKRETRHYAKRQLTWFRRNGSINWLYADELGRDELIEAAEKICRDFLTEETNEKA